MKKVLAILLALSVLALSACAAKQANSDTQKDSNTAETEQKPGSEQTEQPAQEAKRVEPLPETLDVNALTDATVAASFGAEDISEKDDKMELTLTVYDYDVYDMVYISQLSFCDTIVLDGKDMEGRIPEIVADQFDPAFVARASVQSPAEINKLKRYIEKAIDAQMAGKGFSMIEVLAPCPTNWGVSVEKAMEQMMSEVKNFDMRVFLALMDVVNETEEEKLLDHQDLKLDLLEKRTG